MITVHVSFYKILSFCTALAGAMAFIYIKRRKQHKKTHLTTLLRVLFNTRIWLHKSSLLDFQYVLAGVILFSTAMTYLSITSFTIGNSVFSLLNNMLGERTPLPPSITSSAIAIVLIYLAFELGYWLDHFLSHKIPFLWEFHKVHHSAEVLTPFTNWRVHPIDSIVFFNILAIVVGTTVGIIAYWFGQGISLQGIAGKGVILSIYMAVYGHLQHSQVWIPLTGWAGKIIMSPAHHQIHHSIDKAHYEKNFGAGLCLFDWLFGTLYMPTKSRQNITYGVPNSNHMNNFIFSIVAPVVRSLKQIFRMTRG